MNISTNQILAGTGLALVIAVAAPSAQANLLVNPGFEINSLTTASNVLDNFVTGIWGPESASITSPPYPINGVSPYDGNRMLSMTDDGLITTQAFQAIDVSSYASGIDSGHAKFDLSAFFDTGTGVDAAIGAVALQFFSTSLYSSQIGSGATGSFTLDNDPGTWQQFSINGVLPVSTRWLVAQVLYNDASLQGQAGYVDATNLTIPEPTTLSLLAFGGLLMMQRAGKRGKPA